MPLVEIPIDALELIIRYLSVIDTLRLRQTCKTLHDATKSHTIWSRFLHSEIYKHNIPLPYRGNQPIESIASLDLEYLITRAFRLYRQWTSPSPRPYTRYSLPLSKVRTLHFHTTSQGNAYLFTDSVASTRPERAVDCWDLSALPPTRIASRCIPLDASISFNQDPNDEIVLSVGFATHIECLAVTGDTKNENFVIRKTILFQTPFKLCYFTGPILLSQMGYKHPRLVLRDVRYPESHTILASSDSEPENIFVHATVQNNFLIVLRSSSIALYGIASSNPSYQRKPLVEDSFIRPIHQGYLAPLKSYSTGDGKYDPINILIRHSTGIELFPGYSQAIPANTISHYTLFPDPGYDPTKQPSKTNLPWRFPPSLTQTIGAPIRSFGSLPLVLGEYGTGVWVDNHVEEYFGWGTPGERLVGSVLSDRRLEEEGELDLSDDAMRVTMGDMVYDVSSADGWTCVVVDEREGRIAVGGEGGVQVLEYGSRV